MSRNYYAEPPEAVKAALDRSASRNKDEAIAAQMELAEAFDQTIRDGYLYGDVLGDIFNTFQLAPNAANEYPLDPVTPGLEREFLAYAVPSYGKLPERMLGSDYVMIPYYEVGNSITWPLKQIRNSRYDFHARAMEIYEYGYIKKDNNDGFAVLLTAAANRNILVSDPSAGAGRLTVKLITLLQQTMQRNSGGNTTSRQQGKATDIYMSIEALGDMRSWTLADVTEKTRDEIANSADGYITNVFGTNLHPLIEFGVGQEYQNFYTALGGTMASGDVEIMLCLDRRNPNVFLNPIKEALITSVDDALFRDRKGGVWGTKEHGFAVMDNRKLCLASI